VLVLDNTKFAGEIEANISKKFLHSPFLEIRDIPQLSTHDIARGKGAGETLTLLEGLKILEMPSDAIIAKVNARYITTNGLYLIDQLDDSFDFAAWPRPHLDSVDTTFFAGKAGFLQEAFKFVYAETDDLRQKFVEKLYADFSIRNPDCNYQRFSYSPAIIAQSGSTGQKTHRFNEVRMVGDFVRFRERVVKSILRIHAKLKLWS
jgi:hypothetical protein